MKIAVVGSRTYQDSQWISTCLSKLAETNTIETIISGGAKGADMIGQRWAEIHGVPTQIFIPDWTLHGKRAGYLRNEDIVNTATLVLAFWDGTSTGTRHSIELAHSQKKPVIVYIGRDVDKLLTRTTYN